MLKKSILLIFIVSLAPLSYGMSLEIWVNGDPEPDIYLSENETAVLSIASPDGYSGYGDDVYFVLRVETAYGTISGGVVTPVAPDGSSIGPCPPDMACIYVIGPSGNGIWGVVTSVMGTPAPAGVYFDEIVYQAGGAVGDAVIQLYTTQDFASIILEDSVVIHQQEQECLKSSAPEYADWVAWGMPDCWCYPRQCRGDADGCKTGPFWVAIPDLQGFRNCFNKDPILPPGCICYDFDHVKTGPFRIAIPDLNIFRMYFNTINVPCCDIDGDCILQPEDKYNFWINPSSCGP
jgi:hypothetical protein